jgi:hypothetical protein
LRACYKTGTHSSGAIVRHGDTQRMKRLVSVMLCIEQLCEHCASDITFLIAKFFLVCLIHYCCTVQDNELELLLPLLRKLADKDDVRPTIQQTFKTHELISQAL